MKVEVPAVCTTIPACLPSAAGPPPLLHQLTTCQKVQDSTSARWRLSAGSRRRCRSRSARYTRTAPDSNTGRSPLVWSTARMGSEAGRGRRAGSGAGAWSAGCRAASRQPWVEAGTPHYPPSRLCGPCGGELKLAAPRGARCWQEQVDQEQVRHGIVGSRGTCRWRVCGRWD